MSEVASPTVDDVFDSSSPHATVVRSTRGWSSLRLRELWRHRELLRLLVWRDVKIRYKQTVLGAGWAILQPFVTMVVFSVFFGKLARVPSNGVPYPVFAYAALVPWMYFANALTQATNSLLYHERLITRVYIPRLLVPLSAVCGGLVDFGIAFVVLIGLMLAYGIVPTAAVWALPLFIVLVTATALGVGLWLSVLNVSYRDVRYGIPFLIQVWLFVTPVAYPSSLVPGRWRTLYGLNPMAGVVEGFRWALLGSEPPSAGLLALSTLMVGALLLGGLYYFRRLERNLADVV